MTESIVEEPQLIVTVKQDLVNGVVDHDTITANIDKDDILVNLIQYDIGVFSEEDEVFDVETDFSTPGIYYIGQAPVGSSTDSAVWRIRKITETVNGTSVDWAGGTAEFIYSWDDHLTLTYGP